MNFVDVATLTDQTFLVTPRHAGQIVRLAGVDHAATADGVPVRVYGSGLVQLGEGWWDEILITDGEYDGVYFDGGIPDDMDGETLADYEWTGAAHASPSTYRAGLASNSPDPVAYDAAIAKLTRYMHTTTAVSGPTIVQKLRRGEAYGYIVEFVLISGVPWTFGLTRPVLTSPTIPEVIQDTPFNLVPYPSAELAAGTVVAVTNYATNPSVEAAITGWTADSDPAKIPTAQIAVTRTNELASVGTYSAKAVFTAAAANAGAWFGLSQIVPLPGIAATTRYSANVWMSASVQSGAAVLGTLAAYVYWQDAGGATLRVDEIATEPATGGAVSKKSILPPAGTAKAVVNTRVNLTSWSAGDVVRFYADALAVTVP